MTSKQYKRESSRLHINNNDTEHLICVFYSGVLLRRKAQNMNDELLLELEIAYTKAHCSVCECFNIKLNDVTVGSVIPFITMLNSDSNKLYNRIMHLRKLQKKDD